jgi:hypothetical protein
VTGHDWCLILLIYFINYGHARPLWLGSGRIAPRDAVEFDNPAVSGQAGMQARR